MWYRELVDKLRCTETLPKKLNYAKVTKTHSKSLEKGVKTAAPHTHTPLVFDRFTLYSAVHEIMISSLNESIRNEKS